MPFLPSYAYKTVREGFFCIAEMCCLGRVKPFSNADTREKQNKTWAYSHSNSKRPRNIRPMAAGPSLANDHSPVVRPGYGDAQVSLKSH